jgi:hypothetical protein
VGLLELPISTSNGPVADSGEHLGERDVKHFLMHLAVIAALGAAPAFGAEPSKPPPEAKAKPAKESDAKEKLICTRQEVAGSLIPKRVCQTQQQLDAQREAVEDLAKERRELGGTRTEALGMAPSGTLH